MVISVLAAGLVSSFGCKEKGPMEKAGESIDKAAEKTVEKTKEGAEAVGDAAKKAGEKIKDAANP